MATFKYTEEASLTSFKPNQSTFFNKAGDKGKGVGVDNVKGDNFPKSIVDISQTQTGNFYSQLFEWEPKHQNRFIMTINQDIPAYLIKASSKPSMENGEVVIDHINVQRKVKGKSTWSNITITLYDPIIPSGAQAVMSWIRDHHESATGRDGYTDDYKKDIKLQGLGAAGQVVEEWTLKGAFIQSCNWGSYDWSTEDIVTIEMTLAYDYAFLHF